jgi:hypothetical protein
MLNDTDDETSRSPIAVKRGRRSGRARATILRNEVEVGIDPSVLGEKDDGRKRERMERRVVVGVDDGDCDVGARVAGLVTNKRVPCAKAYVGHGGCRLHVEGCGRARRTERARRVPTRPRCKLSIVCDDACEPVSGEKMKIMGHRSGSPGGQFASGPPLKEGYLKGYLRACCRTDSVLLHEEPDGSRRLRLRRPGASHLTKPC